MSTGLECLFFETQPGQWFYALENWNSPKGAFDWREYATGYGPFATFEQAHEHLYDHHANPGGYMKRPYDAMHPCDEVLLRLADEARSGKPRRSGWIEVRFG